MGMGRQKTINKSMPMPYFFARKGKKATTYYFTRVRPAINLGKDYAEALREYADLMAGRDDRSTIGAVAKEYFKTIVPTKSIQTQKDNQREWKMLEPVFSMCTFDDVEPHHVQQYVWKRAGKTRANREKALLSHIWNFARNGGYTKQPNPCKGVVRNKEKGRDILITDDEYKKVHNVAEPMLQDFMDLLLYTGQRPNVTLNITRSDIQTRIVDDEEIRVLAFPSIKNGLKVNIIIEGEFDGIINRITSRKVSGIKGYLISDDNGQPIPYWTMRSKFDRARKKAGVSFQLRDIRAKTASDDEDFQRAHERLGHTKHAMSEHYVRSKKGRVVSPGKGVKK